MIHLDSVVETKQTLLVEVFDNALLIWDEDTEKLHHLEVVASAVWGHLDGQQSLGMIAEALAERYTGDPGQIRRDVVTLVTQLCEEGLVVVSGSPRPPLDLVLSVAAGTASASVDGEAVVYQPTDGSLHLLDPIATMVLACLDGRSALGEICEDLAEVFGAPLDQVQQDVVRLADRLQSEGLATSVPQPQPATELASARPGD